MNTDRSESVGERRSKVQADLERMRETYHFSGPSLWDRVSVAARDGWDRLFGRRPTGSGPRANERDRP